jgi:hypothetical protein
MYRRFPLPASCRFLCALLAAAILTWLPGCTDNQPSDSVSGSVMLGADPVGGQITFVGPDNKEATGLVIDGKYIVSNPPRGKCKVKLIGEPSAGPAGKSPAGGDGGKQADQSKFAKDLPTSAVKGVAPPAKYASPETSGLQYDLKAGKNTIDIKLER